MPIARGNFGFKRRWYVHKGALWYFNNYVAHSLAEYYIAFNFWCTFYLYVHQASTILRSREEHRGCGKWNWCLGTKDWKVWELGNKVSWLHWLTNCTCFRFLGQRISIGEATLGLPKTNWWGRVKLFYANLFLLWDYWSSWYACEVTLSTSPLFMALGRTLLWFFYCLFVVAILFIDVMYTLTVYGLSSLCAFYSL